MHFHMIPAALLPITFFNQFSLLHALLKIYFYLFLFYLFFMQSLPLYTSCLFSMLLNDDIIDIEKPDGLCSLTFVVNEF